MLHATEDPLNHTKSYTWIFGTFWVWKPTLTFIDTSAAKNVQTIWQNYESLCPDVTQGPPEACRGLQGVPCSAFLGTTVLAKQIHDLHWAYRLPCPERFNNMPMIIIDAFPIINLRYSGRQSLYKYAAAAFRSQAYVTLVLTKKSTQEVKNPPADAPAVWKAKRSSEAEKWRRRRREREREREQSLCNSKPLAHHTAAKNSREERVESVIPYLSLMFIQ